jgi:DNA-binding CsgD family transcriptional regulator
MGTTFSRPMLRTLGWLALAEGDERSAARLWEERLATNRELSNELTLANSHDDLGWLALRQGNQSRAIGHFAEELALGSQLNEAWDMARGLMGLGMVNAGSGQDARAAWLFGAAETAAAGINVLDEDVLSPIREPYEGAVAATRAALADEAFAAAWREGRELPTRQAVARALADAEAPDRGGLGVAGEPIRHVRLTAREAEVLRLLVRRLTDQEIADALFISLRTANHHVARIFEKLGVANRREAGAVAVRLGLV